MSSISFWIADGLDPVGMLGTRNFDQQVLISDAVGVKRSMLLVRSCKYG
jgi:hypothetical protein